MDSFQNLISAILINNCHLSLLLEVSEVQFWSCAEFWYEWIELRKKKLRWWYQLREKLNIMPRVSDLESFGMKKKKKEAKFMSFLSQKWLSQKSRLMESCEEKIKNAECAWKRRAMLNVINMKLTSFQSDQWKILQFTRDHNTRRLSQVLFSFLLSLFSSISTRLSRAFPI